ncbi:hypothetical protein [Desulfoluna spongiiphila]|uniref:hypothetical protein n=1 Tax=Desulfoluna spongiiphila TaxID=419481 RepID=UPI00125325FE|nr:hypothetical protein [Desulfoluna spongiiphila]VVS94378.1 prokaryotic membrane lipoprotein lipid attachment site profile [Desulfoluna spongiiphila]
MGYPTRVWLLVVLISLVSACTSARESTKPSKPAVPVTLFSCREVAVPPFDWVAPEDTVYMESEREKGRDVPPLASFAGPDLARRMAVSLKEKGVDATAVSVNDTDSLQDQVYALAEQGYGCVILGRVERYEERIGSDWSVNRPASVAFKMILMDTATGRVLWKGSFDESQQPLSENLLTFKRFVSRKARWVTAADLSETGFKGLVDSMVQLGGRPRSVADGEQER